MPSTTQPKMSDTIEAALTPEAWHDYTHHTGCGSSNNVRDCDLCFGSLTYHERAALCLYGQPFGFTRDDVETLRLAATNLHHFGLVTLADRIEALLPPA